MPDGTKQGLEPPHRLSTTQLDHLSSDSIHSWGPTVLQLREYRSPPLRVEHTGHQCQVVHQGEQMVR